MGFLPHGAVASAGGGRRGVGFVAKIGKERRLNFGGLAGGEVVVESGPSLAGYSPWDTVAVWLSGSLAQSGLKLRRWVLLGRLR